ncbi:MAG: hypothetical protein JWO69_375 [Thermoleophilia bacterium]|jgi:hypothetical protein|nr:hypothetical protein [Thermoleophilia bacterium]
MRLAAPSAAPSAATSAPSEDSYAHLAKVSYKYADVPGMRFDVRAQPARLVYWDDVAEPPVVVPAFTKVSGGIEDALSAAQAMSTQHRTAFAVSTAGEASWKLSPLTGSFAKGGGEWGEQSIRLGTAEGKFAPAFGIGLARLTADDLRIEPLSDALKAIVDGARILRF